MCSRLAMMLKCINTYIVKGKIHLQMLTIQTDKVQNLNTCFLKEFSSFTSSPQCSGLWFNSWRLYWLFLFISFVLHTVCYGYDWMGSPFLWRFMSAFPSQRRIIIMSPKFAQFSIKTCLINRRQERERWICTGESEDRDGRMCSREVWWRTEMER